MAKFVKLKDHFVNPELVEVVAPTEFASITEIITSNARIRTELPIERVLRLLQPPVREGSVKR